MSNLGSIRMLRSGGVARGGRCGLGVLTAMALLAGFFVSPVRGQTANPSSSSTDDGARDGDEERSRPRRTGARIADWSRMSAEEQTELENFIRTQLPDIWQELELDRIRQSQRVYRQHMEQLAPKIVPLMDQLDSNPPRAELSLREMRLDYRIQRLVAEFLQLQNKGGNPERLTALEQEVVTLVEERFDVRQKRRMMDIESLEQRIAFMRKLHDERNTNRAKITRREADALLNPSAALDGTLEDADDDGGDD